MQYRNMGRWGVKVSTVGFGSYLTIGFKNNDDVSRATVVKAYEGGVNFFDAADVGVTAAQLAIAWCLRNPAVTSVITGATKVSQIEENIRAADMVIPDDVAAKIEELYPPVERVDVEK